MTGPDFVPLIGDIAWKTFDSVTLTALKDVASDVRASFAGSRSDVVRRSLLLCRMVDESLLPLHFRRWERQRLVPCVFCSGGIWIENLFRYVVYVIDAEMRVSLAPEQTTLLLLMKEYCLSSICVRCQSPLFY